jgi:hypothetical protein
MTTMMMETENAPGMEQQQYDQNDAQEEQGDEEMMVCTPPTCGTSVHRGTCCRLWHGDPMSFIRSESMHAYPMHQQQQFG